MHVRWNFADRLSLSDAGLFNVYASVFEVVKMCVSVDVCMSVCGGGGVPLMYIFYGSLCAIQTENMSNGSFVMQGDDDGGIYS